EKIVDAINHGDKNKLLETYNEIISLPSSIQNLYMLQDLIILENGQELDYFSQQLISRLKENKVNVEYSVIEDDDSFEDFFNDSFSDPFYDDSHNNSFNDSSNDPFNDPFYDPSIDPYDDSYI
ncbi:MAG: hypothetical protein ACFE8P_07230, partial [Promethearchaeota archaeon]